MSAYPEYVYQMLARAREECQWYCGQADAAALCYDVLAFFPDFTEASDLVYELFCDEWTIYDNRVAIQRNIDEWDDSTWQQRRRLALSFKPPSSPPRYDPNEPPFSPPHFLENDNL